MQKSLHRLRSKALVVTATVSLGLSACGLSGCGVDYASPEPLYPNDYRDRHPLVLAQAPTRLDVFPVRGGLDAQSKANIRSFAERYRSFGSGPMAILTPAGRRDSDCAVVSEIRSSLRASGMREEVSVGSYAPANPLAAAPVILTFRSLKAVVLSRCGQWPRDLDSADSIQGWKNEPYWNYGCATQSMLAAQVNDPRDLVQSRASSPPDEDMRLRAITAVRNGQDPGTNWKITNTAIGTVGGG
jgi:pilus assembly protein CpaD